jgi:hypothetical protein
MAASMRTSLACAIAILVFAPGLTPAATLCVDPNDPSCFDTIQEAIDAAYDFDVVEVHPGVYREHINYNGAMVTVRSLDPNDPAVVESTIIDGSGTGSVVTFRNSEGRYSILQALTIRNGQNGIECTGADTSPSITKCRVVSNAVAGIGCSLASPTITETTIENNKNVGISGSFGETSLCQIRGNGSGKDGHAGLANCKGPVRGCLISGNNGDGAYNHTGDVKNCLISANLKRGLYFETMVGGCNITNCTIVGNKSSGVSYYPQTVRVNFSVTNSIVVLNAGFGIHTVSPRYGTQWKVLVDWSGVWGNISGDYSGDLNPVEIQILFGPNCISQDPLFAKRGSWDTSGVWHEGDYHLKSKLGRYDSRDKTWVTDPMDSPCLDRGDPASAFLDEPLPNGGRINLGAYGGTAEASKSPGGATCIEYPAMDFNHDCKVDQADLDIFIQHWLECGLDPDDACWPGGTPKPPVLPNVQP